jgi:hypothetical protein
VRWCAGPRSSSDNGGWTIVAQPRIMTMTGLGVQSATGAGVTFVGKTNSEIIQV